MLARIGNELYWLGRYLARAEHTARMLDGIFHADLQDRLDAAQGLTLSWESVVAIMGLRDRQDGGRLTPEARDEVIALLTVDEDSPGSILACVQLAREGARAVRDVISAEMWEAMNTFELELRQQDLSAALRTGPYSIYQFVKERCALFWGLAARTMLRDEARSFLQAGSRIETADMVLRMLRVALPASASAPFAESAVRDGIGIALLRATGGVQAYHRSVSDPPSAETVACFLLFQRSYPRSVAASVAGLLGALENSDQNPQRSEPVLRLRRLSADLEFRGRSPETADLEPTFEIVDRELDEVDLEIARRYFAGAPPRLLIVTQGT